MNARSIAGAVALVTGANRGIGRALTEALLARSVKKVYAAVRDPESLAGVHDARLVPLRLDLTDADTIRAVADATADVDIIFNNAGVALARGFAEATAIDHARREMEVNYFGPLQLLLAVAPTLLHSLTQAARFLLATHGTAVFGAYPGPVDTEMSRDAPVEKTSPRDVAFAILDGVEAGQEDIYPDPASVEFNRQFESSPKASEQQMSAMAAALLAGMAA